MRDIDVRAALRIRLQAEHANEPDTRLVEEMGVWSSTVRIDAAVINGQLAGFELKSDSDTLARLPYQRDIYNKVFDRVTLVVGAKHWERALPIIPDWWGVWVAKMKGETAVLVRKRPAKRNPDQDPFVLAQMLWKSEAVEVLKAHGLARGWSSRSAIDISKRLASELPIGKLRAHVRTALKVRPNLGQMMPRDFEVPVLANPNPRLGITARA